MFCEYIQAAISKAVYEVIDDEEPYYGEVRFDGPYTGKGPHPLMWKGTIRVMIPNPHRADVSVDLVKKILRQGEISREEWLSARIPHF